MGKPTGFIEYERQDAPKRPVDERVRDYHEVEQRLPDDRARNPGRPLHGLRRALLPLLRLPGAQPHPRLQRHGLPRPVAQGARPPPRDEQLPRDHRPRLPGPVRGRLHPRHQRARRSPSGRSSSRSSSAAATRAGSCPQPAPRRTGKKVAVIGSGPAGLAAAQQLARAGHTVVVFEKADRPGGILRYGIPDFKLEKWVHRPPPRPDAGRGRRLRDRRRGRPGRLAPLPAPHLRRHPHRRRRRACPRDLNLPGRDLDGIHFAMEFLTQQNRRNAGDTSRPTAPSPPPDKNVVVIGGGDTGADCVGTARRQGARRSSRSRLLPKPPRGAAADNPWPHWPRTLRTSSSHDEGCHRLWSIGTKEIRRRWRATQDAPLRQARVERPRRRGPTHLQGNPRLRVRA